MPKWDDMELIVIGAALLAGVLLILLGRRGRKRMPEGSVFDAAGGSSFKSRRPSGSGPEADRSRLGDLGTRPPPAPEQPGAEPDVAPPPATPPAPALPVVDSPPPAQALPLGDAGPPAWHAAEPGPDWSHALAPPSGLNLSPGADPNRELAEAQERALRAERAREAELREREGRRSNGPPDDT